MRTRTVSALVLLAFIALGMSGCYHATIDTGLKASSDVVENEWASGWLWGLIPPNPISTKEKCRHGVAKVETEHSFVNSLVGMITFGIYTPMHIKATCASSGMSMIDGGTPELFVSENASQAEIQVVFARAADRAVAEGRAVYVKF